MAPSYFSEKKPLKGQPDDMDEIRFFVSEQSSRMRGSDPGSNKWEAEDNADNVSTAPAFHEAIKERAKLGYVSCDIILSFMEVFV